MLLSEFVKALSCNADVAFSGGANESCPVGGQRSISKCLYSETLRFAENDRGALLSYRYQTIRQTKC